MIEDGSTSQSSSQRGASLLERIQTQRQREQQESTPNQINVPHYSPHTNQTSESFPQGNMFTHAWRTSLVSPQADDQQESLLSVQESGEYSMQVYLLTFVSDVYGAFQALPVPIRWISWILLLWLAIWLLRQ